MKHVPPSVFKNSFNCPYCGALAHQDWYSLLAYNPAAVGKERHLAGGPHFLEPDVGNESFGDLQEFWGVQLGQCFSCRDISVWVADKLFYPPRGEAPPANPDLSEDIRRDYDEASRILDLSPRGAAALLRLAIQKLCKELGQSGENLNADIKALVEEGLDSRIQKSLDAMRVIGNSAVHPGQLDLRDDRATAASLFSFLNLIVDKMISEPRRVDEVYADLPEPARHAIEKRDGVNGSLKPAAEADADQAKSK